MYCKRSLTCVRYDQYLALILESEATKEINGIGRIKQKGGIKDNTMTLPSFFILPRLYFPNK